MEQINFIRDVKCEICQKKLSKIYVRGKKFYSLEGFYYCENCQKVFEIVKDDKVKK